VQEEMYSKSHVPASGRKLADLTGLHRGGKEKTKTFAYYLLAENIKKGLHNGMKKRIHVQDWVDSLEVFALRESIRKLKR